MGFQSFFFSATINALAATHLKNSSIIETFFRSLSEFPEIDKTLNSYGCWCYFDSHSEAQGPIMDIYDSFCRDLHLGYSCIMMEEEGCRPWEVDYIYTIGTSVDDIRENCKITNAGNQCKIKACIVEGHFYTRALNMLIATATYTPVTNFRHDEGFNPAVECLVEPV